MFLKDIVTGRMNMRKFARLYQEFFSAAPKQISPPYSHIVQVGDPILRCKAKLVTSNEITTEQFRKILLRMKSVLLKYNSQGLAAPQIGIDKRMFVIQLTNKMIARYRHQKSFSMEVIPLQVWINPEIKVLDYKMETFSEGCESVRGFVAEVPRYRRVLLTGLDENGNKRRWDASGWSARIIQHEMDHLDGKLYLDSMVPKTFECSSWSVVNRNAGRVYISFTPVKWWTSAFYPQAK